MAPKTTELNDIMQTLDALQSRVKELTVVDPHPEPDPSVPDQGPTEVPAQRFQTPLPPLRGDIGLETMSLVRAGIAELSTMSKLKEFPEYFSRLSKRTGLRLLLLKRWNTGLQVYLEQNIKMPPDAKRKRRDGKAPIPTERNDIFESTGQEAAVYCGPVPVKHFPVDMTLMLGRGSRDRQIIILPLPSQGHWNTFLYLDADKSTEKALAVAEILAHFALARMCLLNKGVRHHPGRVSSILKAELYRRQQLAAQRARTNTPDLDDRQINDDSGVSADLDSAEQTQTPDDPIYASPQTQVINEVDPFQVKPEPIPLVPANPLPGGQIPAEDGIDLPEWEMSPGGGDKLTPEGILHHSGELPALPKAACHIMAVIEDPKTTATRLEKALAMDQTLTAKVLRIANSPFYGAVREIRTVSEAIVRLGFVTIRNWTLVTAARSVFLAPGAGMLYQKIWHQSVLSAMAGQLVGQTVGQSNPEGVFIGGLMQNIGQLVLARSHPELFQEILTESREKGRPYHEVERKILGFDHGELGALLIKEWNLSQELEDAVRWHHRFDDDEVANKRTAAIIALGEEIALCSHGEQNDPDHETPIDPTDMQDENLPPLSAAAQYLNVSHSKYAELMAQAKELHIDPHFFN